MLDVFCAYVSELVRKGEERRRYYLPNPKFLATLFRGPIFSKLVKGEEGHRTGRDAALEHRTNIENLEL